MEIVDAQGWRWLIMKSHYQQFFNKITESYLAVLCRFLEHLLKNIAENPTIQVFGQSDEKEEKSAKKHAFHGKKSRITHRLEDRPPTAQATDRQPHIAGLTHESRPTPQNSIS